MQTGIKNLSKIVKEIKEKYIKIIQGTRVKKPFSKVDIQVN